MYKYLLIAIGIIAISVLLNTFLRQRQLPYENVSPEDFNRLLAAEGEAQLMDVRTASEFAEGHLKGAVNIDVQQSSFLTSAQTQLDPSRKVYVYCLRGGRSARAAKALTKVGFQVVNMDGGITQWKRHNLPLEQ